MKRRDLLTAAPLAAAALGATPALSAAQQGGAGDIGGRQFLELRKYYLVNRSKAERFHEFMRGAALPALNRIGVEPVGAFTVLYGENTPATTLYVLLPYGSAEAWLTAKMKLAADSEFARAGADVLETPINDPAYLRAESSLMLAFKDMPRVAVPPQKKRDAARIFELRIYESHSVRAAIKKIHMFNEGGELEIFRQTGLNPVFFGETLCGLQMPNLAYMLCHDDMQARDEGWGRFAEHPDWLRLRDMEEYRDTVSNITDIILRPTGYSQI